MVAGQTGFLGVRTRCMFTLMHRACLGPRGLPGGARPDSRAGMAPDCLQPPSPLSPFPGGHSRKRPCFPRRGRGSKPRTHKRALQTASRPPAWPSSVYNSPHRLGVPALQRRGLVTAFRPQVSLKRGERGAHRNRTPSVPLTFSSFTATCPASRSLEEA